MCAAALEVAIELMKQKQKSLAEAETETEAAAQAAETETEKQKQRMSFQIIKRRRRRSRRRCWRLLTHVENAHDGDDDAATNGNGTKRGNEPQAVWEKEREGGRASTSTAKAKVIRACAYACVCV